MNVLKLLFGTRHLPRRVPLVTDAVLSAARNNPNGYIYAIRCGCPDTHELLPQSTLTEDVPRANIVGAWKIDHEGTIVADSFIHNPRYEVHSTHRC